MNRLFWTFAISIVLTSLVVADEMPSKGKGVGIRVVTHAIVKDIAPERLDDTIKMALLDSGWIPLEASAGHIVAETTVEQKHYVKIDIKYDARTVVIELLEMGDSINEGICIFRRDKELLRGRCIHKNYYVWLERLIAGLPLASAKVEFIKSLNSSPSNES